MFDESLVNYSKKVQKGELSLGNSLHIGGGSTYKNIDYAADIDLYQVAKGIKSCTMAIKKSYSIEIKKKYTLNMRIQKFSLIQLIICFALGILPISLFIGILSFFKFVPINFNNEPREGIFGFFLSLLIVPIFGVIFGFISFLMLNFGAFVFNTIFSRKK